MASPFDPLLDRVTHRLRIDPELRLEVAHELRTHLEDSAAELRAAGRAEEDAVAEAARALGAETELADQLWQANARRLRIRKIARWGIGATLVPAASIIAISALWTTLLSFALLIAIASYGVAPGAGLVGLAARYGAQRVLSRIPASERDLAKIEGDLNQRAARAETILQRSPNDPAAYANYALTQVVKLDGNEQDAKLDTLLPILQRGETIEPANALYPLLESAVLFDASTKAKTDTPPERFEYRPNHSTNMFVIPQYEITNPAQFEAGLAAFRSAASKQYLDAHMMDAAKHQLELLPSNSLDGQLLRISYACQILLPHLRKEKLAFEHIGNVALAAAAKGDRTIAMDWIDQEEKVAALAIQRGDVLVELISAARLKEDAIGQAALVLQKLGDQAGFERERDRMAAVERLVRPRIDAPTAAARVEPKFLSLADHYFLSATTDLSRVDLSPHRTAEYALFDQVSLAIGLFGLLAVIAIQWLIALGTAWRQSKRPVLYFIGWRPVLKILVLAILLPAAVYLAYAWSPLSGRSYGAPAMAGVLVVEYSLVGLIMFATMRLLFDAALRERAAELGLDAQPIRPPRGWQALFAALVALAIVYIVFERHNVAAHDVDGQFSLSMAIGFTISACIWVFDLFTLLVGTRVKRVGSLVEIGIALLVALVVSIALFQRGLEAFAIVGVFALVVAMLVIGVTRWLRSRREELPNNAWRLAILPVELLTVLALAVIVLPLLQARERHATTQFQKPVPYIGHEIENSQYRDLRTQLLQDTGQPG